MPHKSRGKSKKLKYELPLEKAILVKRYKRFLADIRIDSGEIITIHCPNTGSMKNCAEPGFEVYYSTSSNLKRKYPQTWELARNFSGEFIGINTLKANHLVKEAIESDGIIELLGYEQLRSEVKYGEENSRIDLLLSGVGKADCYVEVKTVTLLEPTLGEACGFFPDSVSERGRKHLRELSHMVKQGCRAVLFYCVQHRGLRE